MTSQIRSRVILFALLAVFALARPGVAQAQDNGAITAETYLQPPPEIAEAVVAPTYRNATLRDASPDGRLVLNEQSSGPPSIAQFAKPFYRLGGMQIDWRANRDRRYTTRGGAAIEIVTVATGTSRPVQSPDGATVSSATWSPDGSRIAFFVHTELATHIYVADAATGRSQHLTRSPVLATLYSDILWTADSRSVVTVLLPENRGPAPEPAAVPTGPQVRVTTPDKNRIRTFPDLLEGPDEQAQLEYYSTGQLAVIDVERRAARRVGQPAMIQEVELSPNGQHARVTTMRKPFSYIVPVRSFANAEEVWDLSSGAVLATLAENEVDDGAPDDSTNNDEAPDKRTFAWRPDGQGLSFLQLAPRAAGDTAQSESEGQGRGRSGRKDRVYQWMPPYDASSMTMVYESDNRLSGVRYSADAQILFLTERQGQRMHEYAVLLDDPSTKHTIRRGEGQGFRMDAPDLLTRTLPNGVEVVRLSADGNSVFLSDTEYHDDPLQDGPQSFIDRLTIRSAEKSRVYESENNGVYESVLAVLNDDATDLLVEREGPSDVPDTFFRDVSSGQTRQLTQNVDYTPDLTRAQRRRYNVQRADGFEFAVDVTLPENWTPGERLPGMIWFYPREYTGQDDYDETRERYNKNGFPSIRARSMDILVRRGYAVISPDAPIIGEEGRMNDNYEHDLRNNLAAAIDFLDREGVIDRQRMGVGGHSYGAFGTVNAMVHTPFFKAGIAGDGNFNRTLTPFAFQSERRSLWEAPEIYVQMSPLFHANDLTGALLMYHGAHDQNVGTFPINSWRLFEAMEALGKTASLYVYPYEDHGPATEETLLDLWARWSAWLDKYVKDADSPQQRATTDDGGS